ncbi:VWA domain-containing protein, partial [bacterium]|nr:VWA domain-containing protein [bacterium]
SEYTITTDANGNVIVTESSASDSDGDGVGDVTELRNVETIEFADGTYDTETGTFTSNIPENLVPTSVDEVKNIDFEGTSQASDNTTVSTQHSTNVVIILDLSGSMKDDGGDGHSRLELAKESLQEMISTYEDLGGVNVKLTTFGTTGTATDWMNASDAISVIEALSTHGSTNYEDALFKTYDNYTTAPDGQKSVVYFISDGTPTVENTDTTGDGSNHTQYISGQAVDSGYITQWTNFLTDNAKELNVIGIGTGLQENDPDFQRVAVDIGTIKTNVMVVEDVTELKQVLIESTNAKVEGNVLDNVSGGDGDISISSITVDGTVYTQDTFPENGLTTQEGGKLIFDFKSGDYTYSANSQSFSADTTEVFAITAVDADGDSTTFDLTVNINVDDTASTPTLTMSIGDVQVVENTVDTFTDISVHTSGGTNLDSDYTAHGHDDITLNIDNMNATDITTSSGDDSINIRYSASGKDIDLGSGDDTLVIGGSADRSEINMGEGDDVVQINGNFQGTADTSSHGDNSTGHIDLGSGDDKIQLHTGSNFDNGHIDGGSGNDTLYFTGSASDYKIYDSNNNLVSSLNLTNMNGTGNSDNSEYQIYRVDGNGTLQGAPLTISNIENIVFEADQGNSTSQSYEYNITLNAGLTDTDGSESLSDITLDKLPDGTTNLMDSEGNILSANDDGTYTLSVDESGNANITLVSSAQIDTDSLNSISASVTSTESTSGNETTISTTAGGFDQLVLDGDMHLDLGNMINNANSIESVNLGTGTQNISITLGDVLEMTDDNNSLKIDGDSTDSVTLNNDSNGDGTADTTWTLGDFKTNAETGTSYQEVTGTSNDGSGSVTLEVNHQIHIDQH